MHWLTAPATTYDTDSENQPWAWGTQRWQDDPPREVYSRDSS